MPVDREKKICYDALNLTDNERRGACRMENMVSLLMVGIMVLLGGIPSVYILVSMPVILAQKIYGKIKYGKSLYD